MSQNLRFLASHHPSSSCSFSCFFLTHYYIVRQTKARTNNTTNSGYLLNCGRLFYIQGEKYDDYVRIKTGKDGASQVTVSLGRRFLDVVTEDDLGREIYVQAEMNTDGDRDQYHRFKGSLVYWCDEFDENGNRTTK